MTVRHLSWFLRFGVGLWRWATSSDMPGPKPAVGSLHTSLSSLLASGLGCDFLRALPLHSGILWSPFHLPKPRATKKSSLAFPSPGVACNTVYFCLPQGQGVCPVNFRGSLDSQLRLFLPAQ